MPEQLPATRLWARGVASAVIAALLNVLVAQFAAAQLEVPKFIALQPGPVATITLVAVLLGTAVAAVTARLSKHPLAVFTVVASVVALGSLIAPIGLSLDPGGFVGATPAAARALIPLHLIPAAVLITALAWPRRGAAA